ncbi:MAG: rhodanese-like domain-containing protein [Sphingomonadales bacterium]|nr:rhodanese-like domain-containing protein [Sphingomonadales bacterium]
MSTDISVIELKKRLDAGEKINLIDVREQFEYDEFNLGGELIPLGTLPGKLEDLETLRDEEVIVHCRSGARSGTAKMFLTQSGFTNVRNLIGGVLDWQAQFGG